MSLPEIALVIIAGAELFRVLIEITRFVLERVAESEASKWRNLGALGAGAFGELIKTFFKKEDGQSGAPIDSGANRVRQDNPIKANSPES